MQSDTSGNANPEEADGALGRSKWLRQALEEVGAWWGLAAAAAAWVVKITALDEWLICKMATISANLLWGIVVALGLMSIGLLLAGLVLVKRRVRKSLVFGCILSSIGLAAATIYIGSQAPTKAEFVLVRPLAPRSNTIEMPTGLVRDLVNSPNSPGGDAYQNKLKSTRKGQEMQQSHVTYISKAATPNRIPRLVSVRDSHNAAIAAMLFERKTGEQGEWSEIRPPIGFDKLHGARSRLEIPMQTECGKRFSLVVFVFPLDAKSSQSFPADINSILQID